MKGINGYKKLRYLGSDVHTFELSKSQNELIYVEGIKGKLETLADMVKAYPNAIAAINGAFFNFSGGNENSAKWCKGNTTVILKNDKLSFIDGGTIPASKRAGYEKDADFVIGAGCTLVENGVKSVANVTAGDPYHTAARSILMRTNDGSFMFAVVQGKMKASAGLKAIALTNSFNTGMSAYGAYQFSLFAEAEDSVFLDSGGSSEMLVKINEKWVTVNKPTDGSSRHIGGCFIVLEKIVPVPIYKIIDPKLKFGPLDYTNKPECIIIHHALAKHCTIQDIHRWHLENGWSGVGYHFFCNKLGEIYKGRPDNAVGAHTIEQNMNYRSLGVCLEGCYEDYFDQTDTVVPQAQMNALIWLVKLLKLKQIDPHRKFATYKKCPGNYFPWDEFMKEVTK